MFKKDITPGAKSKLKSSSQRSIRAKLCEQYPLLTPHIDLIIPKKSQLDVLKIPESRTTLYILPPSSSSSSSAQHAAAAQHASSSTQQQQGAASSAQASPTASEPLFYQHMDDVPLIPHLRLVHRFPDFWPRVRVDRGAVRFVLQGAALMVPGFVSSGGRLPGGSGSGAGAGRGEAESAGAAVGTDGNAGRGGAGGGVGDGRWTDQAPLGEGTVVVVEAEGKATACAVGVLRMGTEEMRRVGKGVGIEGGHYLGDGLWRLGLD